MSFGRFTTPVLILTFEEEELDLTTAKNVYVTFRSGIRDVTKTGDDLQVSEKQIGVSLTQADTGRFGTSVEVQANWTAEGGVRYQSNIVELPVDRNILERVVE